MSPATISDAAPILNRDKKVGRPGGPKKSKALNLVLVGLIVVLLMAGVARSAFQPRPEANATVVAAARDLPPGCRLGFRDLHYMTIPQAYYSPEMATKYTDLVGRITNTYVPMREPILNNELLPKNRTIAAVLSPSQRAITLKLPEEYAVDYAIHPGDFVDVLCTTAARDGKKYTKTVCQNLLVLMAVPKEMRLSEKLRSNEQDKLTLAVTAEQAEKLSQASEVSKMRVVLRSPGSRVLTDLPGADDRDLLPHDALRVEPPVVHSAEEAVGQAALPSPPPPPPAPPGLPELGQITEAVTAPARWVVQMFQGSKKEEHEVTK